MPRRALAARRPRAAHVLVAASLGATVVSAGCGDQGSATEAFGARTATSISLGAKLTVGGTISITAGWTDDISAAASARSCADASKGFVQDGVRYDMPHPPGTASFGGHVVAIVATITGYHGPGTYTSPSIVGADGTQTILDVDGEGWAAAGGGAAHVQVNADDSGLLVFEKLTPAAGAGAAPPVSAPAAPVQRSGTLTGTLQWSCSQVLPNPGGGAPTTQTEPPGGAATTPAPATPTP